MGELPKNRTSPGRFPDRGLVAERVLGYRRPIGCGMERYALLTLGLASESASNFVRPSTTSSVTM